MDFTDYRIFGLKDGVAVASAWKMQGKGADRDNAKVVSEWAKRGYDIVTVHRDDVLARKYHDDIWTRAKAAAEKAA